MRLIFTDDVMGNPAYESRREASMKRAYAILLLLGFVLAACGDGEDSRAEEDVVCSITWEQHTAAQVIKECFLDGVTSDK